MEEKIAEYPITVLQEEELPAYKELIDDCFGGSNSIEQYERYRRNCEYQIFVVKDGREIVGSVTCLAVELFTFSFQPCLMLFNVAVKKEARRQGIAKRLLSHVIDYAREAGYHSISLTCLDSAVSAQKLYESVGFQRMNSLKYQLEL